MRILVVRIGRAGDIVMITPALKALLDCYPDAEFTILTSPDGNRLLRTYSPRIKDIWVWNRSSLFAGLEKNHIKKRFKNNLFDKIYCFDTSMSIASLFHGTSAELYRQDGAIELTHSAQYYLNLVEKSCSSKRLNHHVNLPVNLDATKNIDNELEKIGITKYDTIVALHPTYSGFTTLSIRKRGARKHKLWPAEYFGELAQRLSALKLDNGSSPKIIMDLLDNEMKHGRSIVDASNNTIHLLNVTPNIERYKALLKRADLLVTPDTGPMHIAAAVGTRLVALFSGKDPSDCGPFTSPNRYTILRSESSPHPEKGISSISVGSVFIASREQLSKHFSNN